MYVAVAIHVCMYVAVAIHVRMYVAVAIPFMSPLVAVVVGFTETEYMVREDEVSEVGVAVLDGVLSADVSVTVLVTAENRKKAMQS
jgi:hypothetical protein